MQRLCWSPRQASLPNNRSPKFGVRHAGESARESAGASPLRCVAWPQLLLKLKCLRTGDWHLQSLTRCNHAPRHVCHAPCCHSSVPLDLQCWATPLVTPHTLHPLVVVAGKRIPPSTLVFTLTWPMLHDPRTWGALLQLLAAAAAPNAETSAWCRPRRCRLCAGALAWWQGLSARARMAHLRSWAAAVPRRETGTAVCEGQSSASARCSRTCACQKHQCS